MLLCYAFKRENSSCIYFALANSPPSEVIAVANGSSSLLRLSKSIFIWSFAAYWTTELPWKLSLILLNSFYSYWVTNSLNSWPESYASFYFSFNSATSFTINKFENSMFLIFWPYWQVILKVFYVTGISTKTYFG